MYVDQLDVFRCPIAPSWLPKEVKHLGSALVFLVEILSRPSNNLKKSFLENTVHIAWKLCLVTGAKQQNIVNKSSYL